MVISWKSLSNFRVILSAVAFLKKDKTKAFIIIGYSCVKLERKVHFKVGVFVYFCPGIPGVQR